MRDKLTAEIRKLSLNDASYKGCGVSIVPTYVNFFFGNNGTGKSTIGKAIKVDNGVEWQQGYLASDYKIHVYNLDYISANLHNYHNLHGVFTVNEVNVTIQANVDEKLAQKEKASTAFAEAGDAKTKKTSALQEALERFQQECWEKTTDLRAKFRKTQVNRMQKKSFAEGVLEIKNPKEHDVDALRRLYDIAYSDDAKKYELFPSVANPAVLDELEGRDILGKRIVSSADTPFAQFLKKINAASWVQQSHEQFHKAAGNTCPYCQQHLPVSFEENLRACFDSSYQEAQQALSYYYDAYRNVANTMVAPLFKPPVELMPEINITPFTDKVAAIRGVIATNLQKIKEKMNEPASVVEIENVATMLGELKTIIAGFNTLIRENNVILDTKQKKQVECRIAVWEHIAFLLADQISRYKTSKSSLEDEISKLITEISTQRTAISTLTREIAELNKDCVNTTSTIESVNMLLRDSGFQGFSLREKEGTLNVYEVVRPDGTIAENLSEGERNFIAFLYFYHQVKGSDNPDGSQLDKIVVIDDPVSSMDSSALFIVSALVREMIQICENNAVGSELATKADYIKQIFILTHNAYFHREITYNQVKNYLFVNFYLISKVDNKSSIKLCKKTNPEIMTEEINYNSVQNSYAALWEEYKEINAPIPLMNVIRRILEYYFLQLCGYDGVTLRKRLLIDNKDKFITTDASGKENFTQYQMAHAMLSYICANSVGINDGINFVDDCVDVEQTKKTFSLVFALMEQKQHYDMMMGNQ